VWAVVGLGNPGRRYAGTRHNVGFIFLKRVAEAWDVRLKKKRFFSKMAETRWDSERVILAMPQTYMNHSGQAVKAILGATGVESNRLVVVYDDADLPLGEIRIRKQGRAGTHKGMASIVGLIGTTRFPRIRVGIGPVPDGTDIVRYVLAPFRGDEADRLEESLGKAEDALGMILSGDVDAAMNLYNGRSSPGAGPDPGKDKAGET
jgi:PTH1 family peptidyl-tRNA hydrolase